MKFWKGRESYHGLSVNEVYINLGLDVLVVLYYLDNDIPMMYSFFKYLEFTISIWKAIKVTRFQKKENGRFPFYELRNADSYEKSTAAIEKKALKILTMICIPLLAIYAVNYKK